MEEMKINKEETNRKWHLSEFQYDKETGIYVLPEKAIHTISYSDGIKIENYILVAIKTTEDISDGSDELMRVAKDWPSYYHLGIGRSNILKSIDLSANAKVLELGSGCGAITRYLGENFESVDGIEGSPLRAEIARGRCRDLKNVKIFCSNFKYIKCDPTYDIVTLVGVLEYAPIYFSGQHDAKDACLTLLKLAKTALKKDGILIIAIENKIGIKYWSGCPDDHTGRIFDGIHGYPEKRSPITFSKKEMETLLKAVGFSNISFYYCFPDYKFASTIISDIGDGKNFYLHNWVEIPFTSYNISRTYTFHEGLAIKTLSESGLLQEFANSFLIVASQSDSHIICQPDWVAKRFSVKRLKGFRCATTLKIKPKVYVEKKRLLGSNEDYIATDNTIKIKHKATDSSWHEGDLMIFNVFGASSENDFKKKILCLLKMYYQELINRFYVGIDDEEGYPLLRGDSIDFIFRNIIKKKEKFFYVDNEWCVERHIPADYVVCRAVTIDIIGSQSHWIRKKIRNVDKFTIGLIKSFFPNYGKRRHNKNKMLEKTFQNLVIGNLGQINFVSKNHFLNNKIIWNIIKKIWSKLPENIKFKIKNIILKIK